MVRVALIGAGALAVAAVVWMSVARDVAELVQGAGWWAAVVLAWPAFVAFGVHRGWGD